MPRSVASFVALANAVGWPILSRFEYACELAMSIETVGQTIEQRLSVGAVPLLVAIDGRSGVGKSTLAAELAARRGAAVVSGDDFFAGGADEEWMRRSPEERAERCIDWRLRDEALAPLLTGRPAVWLPFYAAETDASRVTVAPEPVIVLDGVYSGRPELADLVDIALLIVMGDDSARRRRLIAREGEPFMAAWRPLWDAAEDHYFSKIAPPARFDLVIEAPSKEETAA